MTILIQVLDILMRIPCCFAGEDNVIQEDELLLSDNLGTSTVADQLRCVESGCFDYGFDYLAGKCFMHYVETNRK